MIGASTRLTALRVWTGSESDGQLGRTGLLESGCDVWALMREVRQSFGA